ncbi:MAG: hypothetical protein U0T68_06295 [Ferruginibacter sp.]
MKKILMMLAMGFAVTAGMAQSIEDIRDLLNKKDYTAAKNGIDKYLADPKNADKAEAWYLKGKSYTWYSQEKTTPEGELIALKSAAYDAFRKYQQLDPSDKFMKLENWGSYLILYYDFYDLGANLFNAKNYEAAFNSFKKALDVENYILSKQYSYTQATLHALDTSLVLNTAIAARESKNEADMVVYFKKLADANVSGKDFNEIYEVLAEYYDKKGDEASLNEILAKGKKLYPGDSYWSELELSAIRKKGDQAALFAKYEELIAKDPTNFALGYNYAVELYNKLYNGDAKEANPAMSDKLTSVLKAVIANDKGIEGVALMANHTYNMASDAVAAVNLVKGTKPEDVKKKNELKAISNKKMDECIVYADQVAKFYEGKTDLKPKQSANYRIVLGYLSDIYNLKGDAKKAAEYDKKKSSL